MNTAYGKGSFDQLSSLESNSDVSICLSVYLLPVYLYMLW